MSGNINDPYDPIFVTEGERQNINWRQRAQDAEATNEEILTQLEKAAGQHLENIAEIARLKAEVERLKGSSAAYRQGYKDGSSKVVFDYERASALDLVRVQWVEGGEERSAEFESKNWAEIGAKTLLVQASQLPWRNIDPDSITVIDNTPPENGETE
jgi:hypothetical protein